MTNKLSDVILPKNVGKGEKNLNKECYQKVLLNLRKKILQTTPEALLLLCSQTEMSQPSAKHRPTVGKWKSLLFRLF